MAWSFAARYNGGDANHVSEAIAFSNKVNSAFDVPEHFVLKKARKFVARLVCGFTGLL
jgi:hypothetical protein